MITNVLATSWLVSASLVISLPLLGQDTQEALPWQPTDQWSGRSVEGREQALEMIRERLGNIPKVGAAAKQTVFVEALTGLKVPLSEMIRKRKPMVLVFGSGSDPATIHRLPELKRLNAKFGSELDFYFVYLRESLGFGGEKKGRLKVRDPATQQERIAAALALTRRAGLWDLTVLADTVEDHAATIWSAWPCRAVVIDSNAKVVYTGGPGPWHFHLSGTASSSLEEEKVPEEIGELAGTPPPGLEEFLTGFVKVDPPRPIVFPKPIVPDQFSGKTVASLEVATAMIQTRIMNAPRAGDPAPDFALEELGSDRVVTLSDLHRDRPVVIFFGSYGCDVVGDGLKGLMEVHDRFKDRINFVMIYIREAHSLDGWQPLKAKVTDPKSRDERESVALRCQAEFSFPFPVLMDNIKDHVSTRWGGWPVRLFVVGQDGRVVYAGRQGPWGYRPVSGFQHEHRALQMQDLFYTGEPLEDFLERYLEPKGSAGKQP